MILFAQMELVLNADAGRRLEAYFDTIGELLGHPARRASFATYAMGLLADGERKSVEPIAARACADPGQVDALQQRLLHLLNDSKWSDRDVRRQQPRSTRSLRSPRGSRSPRGWSTTPAS
jgi:SRSO17 transposase